MSLHNYSYLDEDSKMYADNPKSDDDLGEEGKDLDSETEEDDLDEDEAEDEDEDDEDLE